MVKKCLYCKCEIADDSVIDFCARCGRGVFGDRMLKAIVDNMEKAKETGNLHQGLLYQDEIKADSLKKL